MFSKLTICTVCISPNMTCFKKDSEFRLELFGDLLVSPKIKITVFWESWSRPLGPKTMKVTCPKTKQNNSTELSG